MIILDYFSVNKKDFSQNPFNNMESKLSFSIPNQNKNIIQKLKIKPNQRSNFVSTKLMANNELRIKKR